MVYHRPCVNARRLCQRADLPNGQHRCHSLCAATQRCKSHFLGKLDHWADQEAGVGGELLRFAMPYDTMPAQYQWEQLLKLGYPLLTRPLPRLIK